MYEPITVGIDRDYGDGIYRLHHHAALRVGGPGLRGLPRPRGRGEAWEACPTHPLSVHQHSLRQGYTEEGIHRRGSFSGLPGVRQRTWSSPTR